MDTMAPANPFPGLRPFESEESHLFFGRECQTDELLARLGRNRFLAVIGTSGSGKSSLIRAGLLPCLHGGFMTGAAVSWQVACFRPGNDPIGNLARALAEIPGFVPLGDLEAGIQSTLRRSGLGLLEAVREAQMPSGQSLLVVVDQFEELFRFEQTVDAGRSGDAAAFVKLLLEATAQHEIPIYVVLTMRSDYLGDCARFHDLPERLNDSQYLIPRMTRDQRREAITGPVLVGGGRIAPRLVNRLLNESGDNPDQLPILQHALMRMWDLWARQGRGGEVDLEHDEAVGGMAMALSRHADEAYEELDPRGREIAGSLFKSLTEKGPDNREIRRPVRLAELAEVAQAPTDEVCAVIESFRREGRSFLVPRFDVALQEDTVIDISHESLIRGWQRLKAWVDQEAQSARMFCKVAEDAALHAEGKAALWRDPNLAQALHWREESRPTQAWAERYHPGFPRALSFLDDSYHAHLAELARIERGRVRLGLLASALAVLLIIAAGLAVHAWRQEKRTSDALAESSWLSATHARQESELLKATYFSGHYLESGTDESRGRPSALSAQFGSQAFLVDAIPEASDSIPADRNGAVPGKAVSQDRRLVLTWQFRTAQLRSTDGSPPAPRSLEHEDMVLGGSISPDKKKVLTWSVDGSVRLWNVTGPPLVIRHQGAVLGAELSKDGRSILTWTDDGIARLWSTADGALQAELLHGESLVAAQLVDGQAVTRGRRGDARWWNLKGLRHEARPRSHRDGMALASQIAPEGNVTSPDGRYTLRWNPKAGARLETAGGDVSIELRTNGTVYGGLFSHQGDLLLTWRGDGVVQFWKVPGGEAALPPIKQDQPVTGAVFSRDDSLVLIWDSDCARLWSTVDGTPVIPPMRSESSLIRASFSPDKAEVVTESLDSTVQSWDIGADYDFPRKDWPLLIEVATGATVENGMERPLSPKEWKDKKADYIKVAAEHVRTCKYQNANLYLKQKQFWNARPRALSSARSSTAGHRPQRPDRGS
ncbi:MAG TPA: hypothetical protein VKM72_35430 [Thermoanaerobaculia bacterium]|nr:hypothetical protein [Thermoanaerobaculia bacterium]